MSKPAYKKKVFEGGTHLFDYYYKDDDIKHIKTVNVAQLLAVSLPYLKDAARNFLITKGNKFRYGDVMSFLTELEAEIRVELAPEKKAE